MIRSDHDLPIKRQAELLQISRSSVYYQPRPVSEADLAIMRQIDELHLEYPFAGARMLRDMLKAKGVKIGRKHVGTLMKRMGIEALYRRPNTSKRHPEHQIYPYLLRDLKIERANHVWATDITYIPMKRGFVYLAVILDWASRRVLAWDVSISMEADFCVRVLDEALARYGRPEIFNSDQGSQFTSSAFTGRLRAEEIKISMDGKGCWRDNVFVERLWKSVKYEEVYLHAYDTVATPAPRSASISPSTTPGALIRSTKAGHLTRSTSQACQLWRRRLKGIKRRAARESCPPRLSVFRREGDDLPPPWTTPDTTETGRLHLSRPAACPNELSRLCFRPELASTRRQYHIVKVGSPAP